MPFSAEHARKLSRQYVCSLHFSETDFTLGDETSLDRMAVPNPSTVASLSNSAQHHGGLSLYSSSLEEDHVLAPTKTYSTNSITSLTEESIQIHSDTSLPSVISHYMSLPTENSTFSKEDTSFPLGSADESASGGELGCVNLQSSSTKHKAWHSLTKDLGLDRVAKLSPHKKVVLENLYQRECEL